MKRLTFLTYVRKMSAVVAQRLRRPYADVSHVSCYDPAEHTLSIHSAYIEHTLSIHCQPEVNGMQKCYSRVLRFAAVLCVLLMVGVGNAWGTDATFSWTEGGTMGTNATGTQGQITLSGDANSASGAPAVTSNTLRIYAHRSDGDGASATFTAADNYQITSFTITSSNGGSILKYAIDGGSTYSTFSWSNGESTISNLSASSFTIKNCQNSGKSNTTIQVASVVVTYESTTPSGYTVVQLDVYLPV